VDSAVSYLQEIDVPGDGTLNLNDTRDELNAILMLERGDIASGVGNGPWWMV